MIKKLLRSILVPAVGGGYLWIASKFPDLPLSEADFTETVLFFVMTIVAQFSGNKAVDKAKKKKESQL